MRTGVPVLVLALSLSACSGTEVIDGFFSCVESPDDGSPVDIHASLKEGDQVAFEVCAEASEIVSTIAPTDVVFLFDATGSMSDAIIKVKENALMIQDEIAKVAPDVRFGVVAFRDFPSFIYPSSGGGDIDLPYYVVSHMSDDPLKIEHAIGSIVVGGGGDKPETSSEALWRLATGITYMDPIYDPIAPYISSKPIGWRENAKKIIVLLTDAPATDLPYDHEGEPLGHSIDEAITALVAEEMKVVGISIQIHEGADYESTPDLENYAGSTGSVAPEDLDFNNDGDVTDFFDIPKGDPLVFHVKADGSAPDGASVSISDAILKGVTVFVDEFTVAIEVKEDPLNFVNSVSPSVITVGAGETACYEVTLREDFYSLCQPNYKMKMKAVDQLGNELNSWNIEASPTTQQTGSHIGDDSFDSPESPLPF